MKDATVGQEIQGAVEIEKEPTVPTRTISSYYEQQQKVANMATVTVKLPRPQRQIPESDTNRNETVSAIDNSL